ncbi:MULTISPECIES: PPE family protein [Mycobacterium avium complex (MAC)]|uniref:PPE family protein n=1 Tax=Mycobacterium avium subsp. hominissuis TaxID=439334 RepID=A0A187NF06_MYCAV|nr:PPE family protein [Mycobacterium avium]AKT73068.1 PPE family protein [Mycobacterium avium subsp. hominissuis]MBZ4522146.1 PPE family protein [Mycobacterium avium subsp. hominissuis]MBZ4526673.1 PPE family protein [Mycobacterium avium subsp. hominissuis]MBZ4532385.1 PPE family protein [Mycobacterium avium subsp. hominissuis]MBZ4546054.1 PPE family protein [Mycobacterium avium subsp. hominissuis]
MPDYEVPPEINSGRMYAGLGSSSLMASAAAWQALSAQLGSAGGAFQAVIEALTSTAWLGPSSMTMALAAAPYVVWMIATAEQCQAAAVAAAGAADAFEAARAGVVPPPVIAENRAQLAALVATNFMGFNTPAIMANEAHYGQMWAQDTATMYSFAGQAAGITGTLVPFTPPLPNSDPIGLAAQTAALGQSGGQAAGQQPMNFLSSAGGLPSGLDGETMLSMGPQLVSTIPQALQGLASPVSSGLGGGGLGQFQSLLSPFMSFMNPGMFGGGTSAALTGAGGPGLAGLSGAAAEVEAVAGNAGSLGGLSVPATWAAGAGGESGSTARAVAPIAASGGGGLSAAAAPATTTGGGMYGGTPMAAGLHGRGNDSDGTPRYGKPVKVVRRR